MTQQFFDDLYRLLALAVIVGIRVGGPDYGKMLVSNMDDLPPSQKDLLRRVLKAAEQVEQAR